MNVQRRILRLQSLLPQRSFRLLKVIKLLIEWAVINCLLMGIFQFYILLDEWRHPERRPVIMEGEEPSQIALNMSTKNLDIMIAAFKKERETRADQGK